jgi:hypothetical protein
MDPSVRADIQEHLDWFGNQRDGCMELLDTYVRNLTQASESIDLGTLTRSQVLQHMNHAMIAMEGMPGLREEVVKLSPSLAGHMAPYESFLARPENEELYEVYRSLEMDLQFLPGAVDRMRERLDQWLRALVMADDQVAFSEPPDYSQP